jgi:hypothetical protein
MRVFKNKSFVRFARRNQIVDADLCRTIRDLERGLVDADLGGGLVKQRIARRGEGKSGGFRVLIVLRKGRLAVFVHGFAKSDSANISDNELSALKKLATTLLAYSVEDLAQALRCGALIEVRCNGRSEKISQQTAGFGS